MSWVFSPCVLVLGFFGFSRVAWFTLAIFLVLAFSVYEQVDASRLLMLAALFWWVTGLAWAAHQQLIIIKNAIENVDIEHFDHRRLHFQGDAQPAFIQKLLATYRELGRINAQFYERNKEVEYSALQVIDISSKVKSNVESQAQATDSTAASITEMSQSLQDVNLQVSNTHNASNQASQMAKQGRYSVVALGQSVEQVSQQAHDTQERILQLNNLMGSVEQITETIKQISQQTNLLALNASIEAARAGEFGRGFAVVADEVRSLAQRTNDSTDAIASNIEEVMFQCNEIVQTMGQMVRSTEVCHGRLEEVDVAFNKIEIATEQVNSQMESLSCVSSQQAIATNEISEHISKVVLGAQSNSKIAKQTELVANHLRKLTQTA